MSLGLLKSLAKSALLISLFALVLVFLAPSVNNFIGVLHMGRYESNFNGNKYDNYDSMQYPNLYTATKQLGQTMCDSAYVFADSLGFTNQYGKQHGITLDTPHYTYLVNDMHDAYYVVSALLTENAFFDEWKTESHRKNIENYVKNVSMVCTTPNQIIASGAFTYADLGTTEEEWNTLPDLRKWLLLYNDSDFLNFYRMCATTEHDSNNLDKEQPIHDDIFDFIKGWFD